jgi:hypothetical protein
MSLGHAPMSIVWYLIEFLAGFWLVCWVWLAATELRTHRHNLKYFPLFRRDVWAGNISEHLKYLPLKKIPDQNLYIRQVMVAIVVLIIVIAVLMAVIDVFSA